MEYPGVMSVPVEVEDIDHGWNKVMREIKKLDGSYTAVGWFGHGGNPSDDVAARAGVNEFGAKIKVTKKMRGYLAGVLGIFLKKTTKIITIPSRPFVRKTASLYKRRLEKRKAIEYDRLLAGKQTAKQTLSRLGEFYVGALKYVITNVRFTPDSSITIKRKGSSNTLISTGEMRNATTHKEVMS